jgi:hypothetical protein
MLKIVACFYNIKSSPSSFNVGTEETILKIAHAYEQCAAWHKQRPVLGNAVKP